MTLRWYHWAAIVGGGLWFMQWRKAMTLEPASAETAGENVGGQSQSGASGFSSILGNLIGALTAPPAVSSATAPSTATVPAATPTAAPVVQAPQSFAAPAPSGTWSLTEAQQSVGGM